VGITGSVARPADPLVKAFLAGEPGAFEEIVREHQDRVFTFCARMLSDREEALDAAQEVFLSAYRHLKGFRGEASLSTWLLRIAANNCLNRIRQRTVREGREVAVLDLDDADGPPFQPIGRDDERPDRIAEIRETGRVIESALSHIPPEFRWILLLSDIEGFSNEEVAAMAGIPVGTVKSRLHRSRAALRKMLEPVA
jgi:RNA polymerase sigma-70 factor, ECF subfamily